MIVVNWLPDSKVDLLFKDQYSKDISLSVVFDWHFGFDVYVFERKGHHGRDRMVVGCTTTYAISVYHH